MPSGTPDAERILGIVREAFEELQASQPQNNPEVPLSRDAALLACAACICLLRFHSPGWSDDYIAQHLSHFFPETSIPAHHIDTLFRAACRDRPEWVRDMRQVSDSLSGGNFEEHAIRATITRRAPFLVSSGLRS
ncbi:hypothetical protein MMC22_006453 [Lobaria immixta]|nr:hypothetical protein [Lobaria immixta]